MPQSLINGRYFRSRNVHVFPATFRGLIGNDDYQFDPEARLYTEANFINTGKNNVLKGSNSFIISCDKTSDANLVNVKCVIGGYYFDIKNINLLELYDDQQKKIKNLYVYVQDFILNEGFTDTVDNVRSTQRLSGTYDNAGDLDIFIEDQTTHTDEWAFDGIKLSTADIPLQASSSNNAAYPVGKLTLVKLKSDNLSEYAVEIQTTSTEPKKYVDINQAAYLPNIAAGNNDNAVQFGEGALALNSASFAIGKNTKAVGKYSMAMGNTTIALGDNSHAEGLANKASRKLTIAPVTGETNKFTVAEDISDLVIGNIVKYSFDETIKTYYFKITAINYTSKIITLACLNDDDTAIILGTGNIYVIVGVAGESAHVEGINNIASGVGSHAEGNNTIASGVGAHSEGQNTIASGDYSKAFGNGSVASGRHAVVAGDHNIASKANQVVIGKYNKDEDGEFIIGNGIENEGGTVTRANSVIVDGDTTTVNSTLRVNAQTKTETDEDEEVETTYYTFETNPTDTSISTDTTEITSKRTTITAINEDTEETTDTKVNIEDNAITLQDTDTSAININRVSNAKHIEIKSTNIESKATSSNKMSGSTVEIIASTGATTKIGEAEKLAIDGTSTSLSNTNVSIAGITSISGATTVTGATTITGITTINGTTTVNGATSLIQDAANKIELTMGPTGTNGASTPGSIKLTSSKTIISGPTGGKGVDISINESGTQINVDSKPLFDFLTIKKYILDSAYPIGTIYTSTVAGTDGACPIAEKLGGTWERITDTFLYASKEGTHVSDQSDYCAGDTGGSKDAAVVSHSHTLSKNTEVDIEVQNALEDSTVYTGRGEYSRNLHTVMTKKDDSTANGKNGIIEIDSGYGSYSPSGWDDYHMQEVQIRPNQWHKPDRLVFKAQHSHTATASVTQPEIQNSGESGAGKNMPPYLAVYAWKRVADPVSGPTGVTGPTGAVIAPTAAEV